MILYSTTGLSYLKDSGTLQGSHKIVHLLFLSTVHHSAESICFYSSFARVKLGLCEPKFNFTQQNFVYPQIPNLIKIPRLAWQFNYIQTDTMTHLCAKHANKFKLSPGFDIDVC